MKPDLEAIRARDAEIKRDLYATMTVAQTDRRALLAYVDALRAAAGKVLNLWLEDADPRECESATADLRALLGESHE